VVQSIHTAVRVAPTPRVGQVQILQAALRVASSPIMQRMHGIRTPIRVASPRTVQRMHGIRTPIHVASPRTVQHIGLTPLSKKAPLEAVSKRSNKLLQARFGFENRDEYLHFRVYPTHSGLLIVLEGSHGYHGPERD
jgi:hypothetical protein